MQKLRRILRLIVIATLALLTIKLIAHWGVILGGVVSLCWVLWLENGGTLFGDTKWN